LSDKASGALGVSPSLQGRQAEDKVFFFISKIRPMDVRFRQAENL
jgi:hypothetical protein